MTADQNRMSVYSVTHRPQEGWHARIRLPDYDIEQPSKDITVGSWQNPDGHGLLVCAQNPDDLRAVARLLEAAADIAQRADD